MDSYLSDRSNCESVKDCIAQELGDLGRRYLACRCMSMETYLELTDFAERYRNYKFGIEDWQIVSRTAIIASSMLRDGCSIEMTANCLADFLGDIGVDRYKIEYGYIHGLRGEVLRVLYLVFPYLKDIRERMVADRQRTVGAAAPSSRGKLSRSSGYGHSRNVLEMIIIILAFILIISLIIWAYMKNQQVVSTISKTSIPSQPPKGAQPITTQARATSQGVLMPRIRAYGELPEHTETRISS
ncbi:MAG: hypothetical protein ABWU84_06015 [Pyrobaculum sp.]